MDVFCPVRLQFVQAKHRRARLTSSSSVGFDLAQILKPSGKPGEASLPADCPAEWLVRSAVLHSRRSQSTFLSCNFTHSINVSRLEGRRRVVSGVTALLTVCALVSNLDNFNRRTL